MPRPRTDRRALVDQIIEVFRTHGYDGTSIGQLSTETGLGRASLYHHFPDGKVGMLHSAIAQEHSRLDTTVTHLLHADTPAPGRLRAWADALAAYHVDGRGCLFGRLLLSGAIPVAHDALRRALQAQHDALAAVLIADGLPEPVAHHRARSTLEQVQGALLLARLHDDALPLDHLTRRLPSDLLRSP